MTIGGQYTNFNVSRGFSVATNSIRLDAGKDESGHSLWQSYIEMGQGSGNIKMRGGDGEIQLTHQGANLSLNVLMPTGLFLNKRSGYNASANLTASNVLISADSSFTGVSNAVSNIKMDGFSTNISSPRINMNAAMDINMNAARNISLVSGEDSSLQLGDWAADLYGDNEVHIASRSAGLDMESDTGDYASLYAGDGDVSLDLDGDMREMFGRVNGRNGTNGSTFSLKPTSYNLNVGNGAAIFNIATGQNNSAKYGWMNLKIGNRSDQSVSINIDTSSSRGYMNVKASDRIELAANGGDVFSNGHGNARLILYGDGEAKLASTVINDNHYLNGSSSISAWGGRVLTSSSGNNGHAHLTLWGDTAQLSATNSHGNSLINSVGNRISFHVNSGDSYSSQTINFTDYNGFEVGQASYNYTNYGPLSWKRVGVNVAENGQVTAQSVNSGWVEVDFDQGNSDYAPYQTHATTVNGVYQSEPWVKTYRLNPAFMSVMNDIRLTSRGGARLSEALPNYILKGIYVLTNSYTNGKWPCGYDYSQCTYSMPKYTPEELGLTKGGYEYRCGSPNNASNHPHQGKCVPGSGTHGDYVTFSYNADTYLETCGFSGGCWAHPFLGAVPAPGRSVNFQGSGVLHAQDEGVCPDGYQAVMTLTPSVFELGRVSHINYRYVDGANQIALYEPGFQNFKSVGRDQVNIMQAGTKLGVYTAPICGSGSGTGTSLCSEGGGSQVHGWAIAMGTVTQDPTDDDGDDYVWNVGGIPAGSWSAIAHTYCYFNPARFTMPNMSVGGDGILRSMESGWGHY